MKKVILLVSILCVGYFAFPKNVAAADPNSARFDKVVNRLVEALNKQDYPAIEQDFNQNMVDALPLQKSKPFFESIAKQYGKINKLDPAQFTGPDQAVYAAHYEKAVIDIKIVLDKEDKISGLLFVPHVDSNLPAPKGPADVNNIKKPGKTADANSIKKPVKAADSNEAAYVNAVEDSNRILGELKKDLTNIDNDGQKEIKEWTRGGGERKTTTTASAVLDNKIELAKMAMDQVIKELKFLKTVAVGEGAKKTAAAIDALLADRKVRFEKMIEQMKDDASRLKEKEEKREKSQTRTTRTREGSVTPDRTSMDEKRKQMLKEREEKIKLREERLKKTATKDANSQQDASEDN